MPYIIQLDTALEIKLDKLKRKDKSYLLQKEWYFDKIYRIYRMFSNSRYGCKRIQAKACLFVSS